MKTMQKKYKERREEKRRERGKVKRRKKEKQTREMMRDRSGTGTRKDSKLFDGGH